MTNKEFIGEIHIKDLEPEGYEVSISFHQYAPVFYSAQLPDDKFKVFIVNEIKRNRHLRVDHYRIERNTTERVPNGFLSPYDTSGFNR